MNDIYSEFIGDNIEENSKGILKIDDAYVLFRIWYKESYGNTKVPPKKDLKSYLEKKYIVWGLIRRSSDINTNRIDHLYKNKNLILRYYDLTDSCNIVNCYIFISIIIAQHILMF